MSKRTMVAATTTAALALPAAAAAAVPSGTVDRYQQDYHAVAQRFGTRAPGRNIINSGLAGGQRASVFDVLRSIGTLDRMLHPAPVAHDPAPVAHDPAPVDADGDHDSDGASHSAPAAASAPAPAAAPAASTSSGYSGGYAIPGYIVRCESSGNWHAVNSSSGAGGAYQILPSTWRAYGGSGLPQDASPAEQSAIASKIWAASGPSAWTCG